MKIIFSIFFICILNTTSELFAQTADDISSFRSLYKPIPEKRKYNSYAKNSTNEIQKAIGLFFLFYKQNISSQDGNKCTFYPSCSEYAVKSIQQKGLIKGSAAAADRLTRCHFGNENDYEQHKRTGLKYDPVKSK